MKEKGFLIIQHMPWEGPGEHLAAGLDELEVKARIVEAWHEPLPALDPYVGLIVLGGAPNVDEDDKFPYLRPLKELIRQTVAAGKAYLGFCLGHQLLAHVLGCRVGPLPKKSVGFITGRLTPRGQAHPAFAGMPAHLDLFKWHGQGVFLPIPHGLSVLATSDAAPVEALGLLDNPRVVGLQFDNHAAPGDVERWLQADAEWALGGSGADPAQVLAAARSLKASMGELFRRFLGNFCRLAAVL